MKFMLRWKIPPGSYKTAVENFLKSGAPVPSDMQTLGRWHVPGSTCGWHLVEGEAGAVAEHVAEWASLLEIEVSAVIEDAAAAGSLSKVYGS